MTIPSKVYRPSDKPVASMAGVASPASPVATTITLTNLTCIQTEDNAGADECELRIWADDNYQAHRRSMDNGETWSLGISLSFTSRVKIQLWDLDNPAFPLFDDHDHLGTVIINPSQNNGSGVFDRDGADYRVDWV